MRNELFETWKPSKAYAPSDTLYRVSFIDNAGNEYTECLVFHASSEKVINQLEDYSTSKYGIGTCIGFQQYGSFNHTTKRFI